MPAIHYTNYYRHEVQKGYLVFYYTGMEPANYFEQLLIESEVEYERGQAKDLVKRHLFGVHQRDEILVKQLNDQACAHFQKPFLGTKSARNFILLITLLACIIALAGYFLSH